MAEPTRDSRRDPSGRRPTTRWVNVAGTFGLIAVAIVLYVIVLVGNVPL